MKKRGFIIGLLLFMLLFSFHSQAAKDSGVNEVLQKNYFTNAITGFMTSFAPACGAAGNPDCGQSGGNYCDDGNNPPSSTKYNIQSSLGKTCDCATCYKVSEKPAQTAPQPTPTPSPTPTPAACGASGNPNCGQLGGNYCDDGNNPPNLSIKNVDSKTTSCDCAGGCYKLSDKPATTTQETAYTTVVKVLPQFDSSTAGSGSAGTTVTPSACSDSKKDKTGACNTACCGSNNDCESGNCSTRNGYCQAGFSCGVKPSATTVSPPSCQDSKKDKTGACNPACCATDADCPAGGTCSDKNGYCQSGFSCKAQAITVKPAEETAKGPIKITKCENGHPTTGAESEWSECNFDTHELFLVQCREDEQGNAYYNFCDKDKNCDKNKKAFRTDATECGYIRVSELTVTSQLTSGAGSGTEATTKCNNGKNVGDVWGWCIGFTEVERMCGKGGGTNYTTNRIVRENSPSCGYVAPQPTAGAGAGSAATTVTPSACSDSKKDKTGACNTACCGSNNDCESGNCSTRNGYCQAGFSCGIIPSVTTIKCGNGKLNDETWGVCGGGGTGVGVARDEPKTSEFKITCHAGKTPEYTKELVREDSKSCGGSGAPPATAAKTPEPTLTAGSGSATVISSATSPIDTLNEGERKTYKISGKEYDVSLDFIGSAEAKFTVNGQITNALKKTETFKLTDGSYIGVIDILLQGNLRKVSFIIGRGITLPTLSCNLNQTDKTGACNPACCGAGAPCPSGQTCTVPNGYCTSGKSCKVQATVVASLIDVLKEGERETFTINGEAYDVTLDFVGSAEAKFTVNGQITNALKETEIFELTDGMKIGVIDIILQDWRGDGFRRVRFAMGREITIPPTLLCNNGKEVGEIWIECGYVSGQAVGDGVYEVKCLGGENYERTFKGQFAGQCGNTATGEKGGKLYARYLRTFPNELYETDAFRIRININFKGDSFKTDENIIARVEILDSAGQVAAAVNVYDDGAHGDGDEGRGDSQFSHAGKIGPLPAGNYQVRVTGLAPESYRDEQIELSPPSTISILPQKLQIGTCKTLFGSGSVKIVIVPCGYSANEAQRFESSTTSIANDFASTEPFKSLSNKFSIISIDDYSAGQAKAGATSEFICNNDRSEPKRIASLCGYDQLIILARSQSDGKNKIGSGYEFQDGTITIWDYNGGMARTLGSAALHEVGHSFGKFGHLCNSQIPATYSPDVNLLRSNSWNCGYESACKIWKEKFGSDCYLGCHHQMDLFSPVPNGNEYIMCLGPDIHKYGFTPVEKDILTKYLEK